MLFGSQRAKASADCLSLKMLPELKTIRRVVKYCEVVSLRTAIPACTPHFPVVVETNRLADRTLR
jgi:hypothetical protein